MRFSAACLLIVSSSLAVTVYVPDDFSTIQGAINASSDGDTVIVRAGTYYENLSMGGSDITVRSETTPEETIIDGSQWTSEFYKSVVYFGPSAGPGVVLEGFTLMNGAGSDPSGAGGTYGGGIYCHTSSPTIIGNILVSNQADLGSAICSQGGSPTIAFNTIANQASSGWGALLVFGGSPSITHNVFYGNPSCNIWLDSASPGVHIENNVITGSSLGIRCVFGSYQIANNTIVDNTYAGVSTLYGSFDLLNCIIWNPSAEHELLVSYNSTLSIEYSDVRGGQATCQVDTNCTLNWGDGMLEADPVFVSGPLSNYHLDPDYPSPCIDAGNPDPMYNDPEDPANPGFALWPALGAVRNDMGAYGGFGVWSWLGIPEDPASPLTWPTLMAFPNPCSSVSTVLYELLEPGQIQMVICDLSGRVVRDLVEGSMNAGAHTVAFDGSDLPSGIYLCRLQAGASSATTCIVLIR